jgi:nitric oxide reductase activation protein
MFTALIAIPRCDTRLLGFGDVPVLIKGKKPLPLDTVLGRIPVALAPKGGTDFPLALYECLSLAAEARAYKKLVVMLTDGDLVGRYDVEEVLERARRLDVDTFCVGVQGSEEQALAAVFGPRNAVYVPDVQRLAGELKDVVVGRG